MRYPVVYDQWKQKSLLMARDTLSGTHLRSHQAAVSAPIHIPAGEGQLQPEVLISQAATEIRDHQPGAAVWGGTGEVSHWLSLISPLRGPPVFLLKPPSRRG